MSVALQTDEPGQRLNVRERRELGRGLRKSVPRSSQGEWTPPARRSDPVELIDEQNESRLAALVPVRHGRMSVSPFTFYRGAARIMASDLASTPVTGLDVQACGDAHLSNFGVFASPERRLVFDINDFDETLTGPWEWDLKRLVASFTIAGQHNDFDADTCDRLTRQVARAYREAMAGFAGMQTLDVWYAHLPFEDLLEEMSSQMSGKQRKRAQRFVDKARSKDSLQAHSKLSEEVDGRFRIRQDPPLLLPFQELHPQLHPAELDEAVRRAFADYGSTLAPNRRHLLGRFRPADVALKVVGVGSVGTRCAIMLLEGRDHRDPLFLQVKEASPSVLEEYLSPSPYANQGERVVKGQRLTQAVSDIFLGWTESAVSGHHYYWRQLRDWKGSAALDTFSPRRYERYARVCGWTLARAHARTGDAVAIAGYLGSGKVFDRAMSRFAADYARQNVLDYKAFTEAIASGRIEADTEH